MGKRGVSAGGMAEEGGCAGDSAGVQLERSGENLLGGRARRTRIPAEGGHPVLLMPGRVSGLHGCIGGEK